MRKRVWRAGSVVAAALLAGTAWAGPLNDAARLGDGLLIEELVEAGADVDKPDATGETPLMSAALASQWMTVDLLLVLGADAMARNDRGMLALHAAAFAGRLEAVSILLGDGAHGVEGENILDDARNKFGVTPLIVAAEENRVAVVEALIAHGANIEITERHGYTALTRAAYHGHDAIITLLLKAGAICQEIDPLWFKDCTARKAALDL